MAVADGIEGDRAAARACAAGRASACSLLGRHQLLRGLAKYAGDDRRLLTQDAADLLERGCALDDWTACLSAASAHAFTRGPDAGKRGGELLARGAVMAQQACADGDHIACKLLADDSLQRGDRSSAIPFFERACALLLGMAEDDAERATAAKEEACEDLVELGRPLPTPIAFPKESRGVDEKISLARRVSGTVMVVPPDGVKMDLHKRGLRRIRATMYLCVSAVGLVEGITLLQPSRWPAWDLRLLEAVRRWRFDPYTVDGVPRPVCSSYNWIYNQKN
jgi:hypothetical protein